MDVCWRVEEGYELTPCHHKRLGAPAVKKDKQAEKSEDCGYDTKRSETLSKTSRIQPAARFALHLPTN